MRTMSVNRLSLSEAETAILSGSDGSRLTAFAAARLGLSRDEATAQLRSGLVPLLVVALEHGSVVPSPTVGTLVDLVRECGSQEMKDLLPSEGGEGLEPAEFLEAYGRTRDLVLEISPNQPNARLWPEPAEFAVSRATTYKGLCGYSR